MTPWMCLVAAVVSEVVGVTVLAAPRLRHRPVPRIAAITACGGSTLFLIPALGSLPLEAVYGIWSRPGERPASRSRRPSCTATDPMA